MEEVLLRWIGQSIAFRTEILWLVALILSVPVSIHVLLHKREIGASIGWIGLAWLSPIVGATLYVLFGVNRVTRRAKKLRVKPSRQTDRPDSDDPETVAAPVLQPLDEAVSRITGLPLLGGNAVLAYRNGDEAYPAMLEAIGDARRSIALSSYIFRDDTSGRRFLAALAEAKARGVEVRVIVDGIGSGYLFPAIERHLRTLGLPVGRFMHSALPWRMPFLNLRSHKKLLVADGSVAFTGGINISEQNEVSSRPRHPIRDLHFKVTGPVVEQLTAAFVDDWALVADEDLDGPPWFPALAPTGPTLARVVSSGPDADVRKIELAILQAVSCARRSIRLVTPYFLPSEVMASALALAAGRGLSVDVIVPATSDHPIVDWAMRAHIDPLLEAGVRIWFDDPPFDHSKVLVVDKAWCFVGSANWDMRSLRLNFELNVEIYDEALAVDLDAFMAEKMNARLTPEDLSARSLPVRLRDASVRLLLPYL